MKAIWPTIVTLGLLVTAAPALAASCGDALHSLDTDMRRLGVSPPIGVPGYYGVSIGTESSRGQLWSLYEAARSLEQKGKDELCLEVAAEARDVLAEMERSGALKTVTAPLLGSRCRVDTLVDLRVRNREGEDLGHIKDVVIDLKSGKVDYALLVVGGVLDIGGKLFPIPWDAFEIAEDGHSFVLPVDKAALEKAPGFERDVWPDMQDPEWSRTVHDFYDKVVEH